MTSLNRLTSVSLGGRGGPPLHAIATRRHARAAPLHALALALALSIGAFGDVRLLAQPNERALLVSVLDPSGAPVTDLTASDFIVREDGREREVLRATRATEPMQIAVLVDNSQAASAATHDIRDGLAKFVRSMAGKNEIALVTFGDRATIVVEYTSDAARLAKGVERIFSQTGSGAYLLDAIYEVSRGIQKREATRPVILVVTTEGREFSNRHYDVVLEPLAASGASLHALVLTDPNADLLSDEARSRSVVLDRGTRESGGRRDNLLASMAVPGKLDEVARELSNQYRVVYARPASLIPPEKIDVSVKRLGLTARGSPVRVKNPAKSEERLRPASSANARDVSERGQP